MPLSHLLCHIHLVLDACSARISILRKKSSRKLIAALCLVPSIFPSFISFRCIESHKNNDLSHHTYKLYKIHHAVCAGAGEGT